MLPVIMLSFALKDIVFHAGYKGKKYMEVENETLYFKQVSLFADLAEEDIRDLMAVAKRRTFRSSEVIFHREDSGHVLYIVKERKVKICLIRREVQEITPALFDTGAGVAELAI